MSAKQADALETMVDLDLEKAAAPSLRGRLVSLDEPPPPDAKLFDKHFALLDERDHARTRSAAEGKKAKKGRPMAMEESKPDKPATRTGKEPK